jgi:hypothetical protein
MIGIIEHRDEAVARLLDLDAAVDVQESAYEPVVVLHQLVAALVPEALEALGRVRDVRHEDGQDATRLRVERRRTARRGE